jgi:hypothetical protein
MILAGIATTVRPKIANPGRRHQVELWSQKIVNPERRHQVEIWSHRLQILEKDIQWRCAVKDCESWKKTSSGDVESSSFKTRGL